MEHRTTYKTNPAFSDFCVRRLVPSETNIVWKWGRQYDGNAHFELQLIVQPADAYRAPTGERLYSAYLWDWSRCVPVWEKVI